MLDAEKKVVWILGSGFSKSLGGPLLNDLLSFQGEAFVKAKFPDVGEGVYDLFRKHLRGHVLNAGHPVYWDHAEEFLDFVNSATPGEGNPRYEILARSIYGEPERERLASAGDLLEPYRIEAVRSLAAECLFTTHSSTKSEPWGPYRRWARGLGRADTIITFNYDMVLEKLGTDYDKTVPPQNRLNFGADSVVLPQGTDAYLPDWRSVRIFKLHGSVGWHTYTNGVFGTAATDDDAAQKLVEATIPFIVGPGPDKLLHQEGALKKLWDRAMDHLQAADVVVFLGYRFPPSDSQARTVLLEALKRIQLNKYVRIHTVLGPNVQHENTVRLSRLLAHTLEDAGRHPAMVDPRLQGGPEQYHVFSHAMYVEDFLSVCHPRMLYGLAT